MFFQSVIKSPICFLFVLIYLLMLPASAVGNVKYDTQGEKIYMEYCRVCHGDKGDGKTFVRYALKIPPVDFTTPKNIKKLSLDRMKRSVYYGRPSTAMVAWKDTLPEKKINEVIAFIRQRFMDQEDDKEKIENFSKNNDWPIMTKESAEQYMSGKITYQKLCFQCHGINGDADTPVKQALLYPPRNFTDPAVIDTLYSSLMFYSIKNGINDTAMPSWKYELTDDQIIEVVVYIKKEFMNSVP